MARKPERPEPGRMDEGLPSEGQIGDARARDVMRLIAAALAGGFAGYSGRGSGVRARREADELTQQRQTGIARREAAKGQAVQQMDARAEREAAREQEMTLAQQRLAESARERDAGLDIQRQRIGIQERGLEAELGERQRSRAADAALDDVASAPSAQMRTALMVRLSQEHPTQRAAALEALGGAGRIEQMTGREAQQALAQLARPQVYRGTGGGTGTGGPRVAPQGVAMAGRVRVGRLVDAGMLTESQGEAIAADLASPNARVRAEAQRQLAALEPRGRQGQAEGQELLPGVRATIDIEPGEARSFRHGFSQMRSQYGALGQIERVAQNYGPAAVIDRRAAGEMAAPLTRLRAMVAQLQNTGVINPSEAPAIEAMLPNPQSLTQMTFGDLQARLGSFRGELERAVEAELVARGVDEQGVAAARSMLRGGGAPRRPQAAPGARPQSAAAIPREARRDAQGNVVMYGPNGPRRVPEARVAEMQQQGWTFQPGGAR
jgi:hypothetical protein